MKCLACGYENPDDVNFCAKCGANLTNAVAPASSLDNTLPTPQLDASPLTPPQEPSYSPPPGPAYQQTHQPPYQQPSSQSYQQPTMPPSQAEIPPDGNTSGMGERYPVPDGIDRFSLVGCIPFGIFALANKVTVWGVIALVADFILAFIAFLILFVPLWVIAFIASLVCTIYICIKGRALAWQMRRFESLQMFEDTMRTWNIWGVIALVLSILTILITIPILFLPFAFSLLGLGL